MSTYPDRKAQVLAALRQCIVWHPDFKRAYELSQKSMCTTKDRQAASSMILTGETGVGKSTLCERIKETFGGDTEHDANCSHTFIQPCLLVEVPPKATTKTLAIAVLTQLGLQDRIRLEHMGSASLDQLILQRLVTTEVKLVILDEFHRILDQGATTTKKIVCRWVNQILNQGKIAIMLVGLPSIEQLIDSIEELSDRYPYRAHLRYFNFADKAATAQFHKVIQLIEHNVIESAGFAKRLIFSEDLPFDALCLATNGNFRHLNTLLNDTLTLALKRPDNKLTLEDFAKAADDLDFCSYANPFRLSSEALSAALKKKYEAALLHT